MAALVAAGCGTGFDEERENAKPLKVAHASGESKVPGLAKRPLALTDGALDAILALHEQPVAALLPGGRAPAYLRRDGVEVRRPLVGAHMLRRGGDRPRRDPRQQGRPGPPLRATERDRSHGVQRGRHRAPTGSSTCACSARRSAGPTTPRPCSTAGTARPPRARAAAALRRGHARGGREDPPRRPARGSPRGVPRQGAARRGDSCPPRSARARTWSSSRGHPGAHASLKRARAAARRSW